MLSFKWFSRSTNAHFEANHLSYKELPKSLREERNIDFDRDIKNKEREEKAHYFEDAVNDLIHESEVHNMIVRVSICDKCSAGTGYCTEKVDKESGSWFYNRCSFKKYATESQYYPYNEIASTFPSLLQYAGTFEDSQNSCKNPSRGIEHGSIHSDARSGVY
ncbi:hypothetical protein WICPIJ_000110 [Wickerhamomyces pijperi]|uniref:Uncharacterized protein n=1 Tax=Wickerhamomyces pijperi TaxID=599730 RepID=A0A9P8QEG8_WICPI|nr:hypothetical protein WICPIJ_000110 [Wickerhamomyces pijperi]